MAEPNVSPLARRDLEDIFNYIEVDDPAAAERVICKIEGQSPDWANPFLGPAVLLPGGLKLRKMSASPYLIFYCNVDAMVQVVRILHSPRDLRDPRLFPSK